MARDDPHFRLRIPPALKARIEEAAHANGNSLNAEIVARLEASFDLAEMTADLQAHTQKTLEVAKAELAAMAKTLTEDAIREIEARTGRKARAPKFMPRGAP